MAAAVAAATTAAAIPPPAAESFIGRRAPGLSARGFSCMQRRESGSRQGHYPCRMRWVRPIGRGNPAASAACPNAPAPLGGEFTGGRQWPPPPMSSAQAPDRSPRPAGPGLTPSAAPPLPTANTSLVCGGDPRFETSKRLRLQTRVGANRRLRRLLGGDKCAVPARGMPHLPARGTRHP